MSYDLFFILIIELMNTLIIKINAKNLKLIKTNVINKYIEAFFFSWKINLNIEIKYGSVKIQIWNSKIHVFKKLEFLKL